MALGKRFDPLQLSDQQVSVPYDVGSQLARERVQNLGRHAVCKAEHLVERVRACVQIMADDDVHARAPRGDRVLARGDDIDGRWFVGHCRRHQDERKLNGGWPTRCQSSVSMWPEGAGGFSGDVKAGKVLNRMFQNRRRRVIRSNSLIIEVRRAVFVVMIGT